MQDEAQIIFVDTPGIFLPKRRLDRAMVNAAWQGAADNDVLLLLNDCARVSLDNETKMIIAKLVQQEQAAALILNKIDLLPYVSFNVEKSLEYARKVNPSLEIFQVSSVTGEGLSSWYHWLENQLIY